MTTTRYGYDPEFHDPLLDKHLYHAINDAILDHKRDIFTQLTVIKYVLKEMNNKRDDVVSQSNELVDTFRKRPKDRQYRLQLQDEITSGSDGVRFDDVRAFLTKEKFTEKQIEELKAWLFAQ